MPFCVEFMEKTVKSALPDGKGKDIFNNIFSFVDSWSLNKINNMVLLILVFFLGGKGNIILCFRNRWKSLINVILKVPPDPMIENAKIYYSKSY